MNYFEVNDRLSLGGGGPSFLSEDPSLAKRNPGSRQAYPRGKIARAADLLGPAPAIPNLTAASKQTPVRFLTGSPQPLTNIEP
jgi:hypothetical protein